MAGSPVTGVTDRARVVAGADEDAIRALMRHTGTVAEIQNTLRQGMPVTLVEIGAVTARP